MNKTRKSRFFNDLRLRKSVLGFILSVLVLCGAKNAYADGTVAEGGKSDAVVTIRSQDAERLRELNRLRDLAMQTAEKMKKLELELSAAKQANAVLNTELIELRTKLQAESESLRQMQLWFAGVLSEGTVRKSDKREEQQLLAIGRLSKDGVELALNAVDFCDYVQILLQELPIGKVRQAEYRLRLDDLARKARRFIAGAEDSQESEAKIEALRTCRILAVNRELRVVVLSVGSINGAFAGMIYRSGKNRQEQLKVLSVRPAVAAAILIRGSIENLTPGMEAVAGEERAEEESGR
ncbi:MAG: hypothetical protein LBM70_05250 [Victivallales bacterium]|nr:hypothetical protein [Victivallales bacterium]